jgi:putative FmdB family regulatory protein
MPAYDYTCSSCDQLVTIVARIDQTITAPVCAKCAAEMKRNYTPPLAQFKGSGFYSTDKGNQ